MIAKAEKNIIYVSGYEKTAHFARKMIFQYKRFYLPNLKNKFFLGQTGISKSWPALAPNLKDWKLFYGVKHAA